MSVKDAERILNGMGKTIASNTPGPAQLAGGFRQVFTPGIIFLWGLIVFICLFADPIGRWLAH